MPMYQFTCRACGHDFDRQLRMSQAGETQTCPSCSSRETRKVISGVALGGRNQGAVTATRPVSSPFT